LDKCDPQFNRIHDIKKRRKENNMGILSTIFEKLGLKKKEAVAPNAAPQPGVAPKAGGPSGYIQPAKTSEPAAPLKPAPMEMVDVVSKLDQMAKGKNLDWKVSIVDLLKVLGIDSSLENRKELAVELGCPKELMGGDNAKMNMWLHKAVLKEIAENGGNVPRELTD
jgi:hypothetical protein